MKRMDRNRMERCDGRRGFAGFDRALLAVVLAAFMPAVAQAAGRVALVVGNGAYEQTSPLANPVNDAEAVGAALERIGFDVTVLRNADEDAMDDALGELAEASTGADVSLLFYAGHGMEMNGANYLIPVDARLASASAVPLETIPLDSVLGAMANARTRIVILDACRNNPFERSMRGAIRANVRSGGLAAVTSGEGLLVAYAAAAGDVALDGNGAENSPYTTALLEHLESPGVDVRIMLGNVGADVMARTGDQQPFISASLSGEHHLNPLPPVGDEGLWWQTALQFDTAEGYEEYLRQFPGGGYARMARMRLADLRDPVGDPPPPEPPTAATDHVDIEQIDIARLRLMAGQGDARAQTELGERYEEGRGIGRDYGMAVSWFRRAAEQAHAPGQAALGFMYSNGRGVSRDDNEAVRWYRLAADQGNARGQNNLGTFYSRGRGVSRDDNEAVRWYRLAADQGYAVGYNNLGRFYRTGRGVPRDDSEAMRLHRLAAAQGNALGQSDVGFMYANGRGVPRDDGEAVRWYCLAADQGDALGQLRLGFMYANGRGVPRDDGEAARLYRLAADQGNAVGQNLLGWMYANGRGVSRDYGEAVRWYRLAADQGNALAQNNLGIMYELGRGVPRDDEEAIRLYRLAAGQGEADAQHNLDRMLRDR